jgi:hypothetical protein
MHGDLAAGVHRLLLYRRRSQIMLRNRGFADGQRNPPSTHSCPYHAWAKGYRPSFGKSPAHDREPLFQIGWGVGS